MLACSYSSRCSGCDWLLLPAEEQRHRKIDGLRHVLGEAVPKEIIESLAYVDIAEGGLRDRVDLMLDRSPGEHQGAAKLGLFDRFKTGIVDLEGCPQLSPALESWLQDFRRLDIMRFPIARGSVRLRVGPQGQRGVWLDFANIDIKKLLDERATASQLLDNAIVEIGQRRKRLTFTPEGRLKLADPVLENWFETYIPTASVIESNGERAVPLYCTIGSFTQPGFRANRALVRTAMELVRAAGAQAAIEFGSGIGNFTLPLAAVCATVDAFEVDTLALEGLEKSAAQAGLAGERIRLHAGNFQGERAEAADFSSADLVFVDPPRSGLMNFLEPVAAIAPNRRPLNFVYVSCFAESFAVDARRLRDLGYRATSLAIVDQFPQSRHFEIVASFRLNVDS